MKPIQKSIAIVITVLAFSQNYAQTGVNSSFGNASGSEGSIHYSLGQVFYSTTTSSDGEASQGVQKAFEVYIVGLGEGVLELDVEIYPNPTSGILTLSSTVAVSQKINYSVYDQMGKLIERKELISQNTQIDLSALETGLYFIYLSNDIIGEKIFKIIKN